MVIESLQMSIPKKPPKAKLFASIIFNPNVEMEKVLKLIADALGKISYKSYILNFTQSDYYEKEMGRDLKRVFLEFDELIERDAVWQTKHRTNLIEEKFSVDGKRKVNIDPGLVNSENVILITGKNYSHRIYLRDGIFAEITLIYEHDRYRTLPWTYPDYASDEIQEILKKIRENCKNLLKKGC